MADGDETGDGNQLERKIKSSGRSRTNVGNGTRHLKNFVEKKPNLDGIPEEDGERKKFLSDINKYRMQMAAKIRNLQEIRSELEEGEFNDDEEGQKKRDDVLDESFNVIEDAIAIAQEIEATIEEAKEKEEERRRLVEEQEEKHRRREREDEEERRRRAKEDAKEEEDLRHEKALREIEENRHRAEAEASVKAIQERSQAEAKAIEKNGVNSGNVIETRATGICSVKLPKLELPKFSGEITKWPNFWQLFKVNVHDNKSVAAVTKLSYLKAQLHGEALRSVESLETTAENYEKAVTKLQERFGNTKIILDRHDRELREIRPSKSDPKSLREMIDAIENHLISMKNLGENVEQSGIRRTIEAKLPTWMRIQFGQMGKDTSTVEALLEETKKFIAVKEEVEATTWQETATSPKPKYVGQQREEKKSFEKPKSTMGAMAAPADQGQRKTEKTPKCLFCEKKHRSIDCTEVIDLEERKKKVKDRCQVCLYYGKCDGRCKDRKCKVCGEVGNHHPSICPKVGQPTVNVTAVQQEAKSTEKESANGSANAAIGSTIVLQTAETELVNPKKNRQQRVKVLFDTGSTQSYIMKKIADRLQPKSLGIDVNRVNTFGTEETTRQELAMVEVSIRTKLGELIPIVAGIKDVITGPIYRSKEVYNQIKDHLDGMELADPIPPTGEMVQFELLIGIDNYHRIVTGAPKKLVGGLMATDSKVGVILSGKLDEKSEERATISMLVADRQFNTLPKPEQFQLKDIWELETVGIKNLKTSEEDGEAARYFEETTRFVNGRYEVKWPYKDEETRPPENRQLAEGRLKSVQRRLLNEQDGKLISDYDKIIRGQEEKGVVEKVEEETPTESIVHYLAHHPVITVDKTTKVRIVYDGSAKTNKGQKSLNECLYRGPVLLEDICHLLLRFRMNKVAMISDIEKAFLQVGLQKEDRDVTRFLWLKDTKQPATKENLQIYRFARVPFGVISSPFLLNATIRLHLQKYNNWIAKSIEQNIYVDNVITGCHTVEKALEFYSQAKEIFTDASMNLREWTTNDATVHEKIPSGDRVEKKTTKVLGVEWNTETDEISIKPPKTPKYGQVATKRVVLATIHAVFDPLGLLAPITVEAKKFLQQFWDKDRGWDDPLKPDEATEWERIAVDLSKTDQIKLPRWTGTGTEKEQYEIHCFCDASKIAYAACIYLLTTTEAGKTWAALIFAKSRLAPIARKLEIPKLELMAAQIGAKLVEFVEKGLKINAGRKIVWSDSQCVLMQIRTRKPLQPFVERRINEIKAVKGVDFRYVPTNDNPADIATRGKTPNELASQSLWWEGPEWLKKDQSGWPKFENFEYNGDAEEAVTEEEVEPEGKPGATVLSPTEKDSFDLLAERTSRLNRLLRTTAWIKRFIEKTRKKRNGSQEVRTDYLQSEEIEEAERFWIRRVQQHHYADIIGRMEKGERGKIGNLFLLTDEHGILRCQGRLDNADLTHDQRNPILLPKRDRLTEMVIDKAHSQCFHAGTSQTLATTRDRYWIIKGRQVVYHRLKKCPTCAKHHGGPFRMPGMPSLPVERVTRQAAFESIGVDYMGPLFVRNKGKRASEKRWICVFVCAVTRAMHLEVVQDQTPSEFIQALSKFISLRRPTKPPKIVWSDNGSQFRATRTQDTAANYGIRWKWFPERSPWMAGFYERLIQIVKRSMKKALGAALLNDSQLAVAAYEIAATVNRRPLTYVNTDINDRTYLSPAHFLHPPITATEEENRFGGDALRANYGRLCQVLDRFWEEWKKSYLIGLRETQRSVHHQGRIVVEREPAIGEMVHIREDGPRNKWKIGRIHAVNYSNDGRIRSVKVRISNGVVVTRSITDLYPFEKNSSGGSVAECAESRE